MIFIILHCTKVNRCIDSLPWDSHNLFPNNLKNKLLIIKAKYDVIEPHYMEGTTPDHLV
jgi:hypothetical protein